MKSCMSKNILVSFLKAHGSEVENMLITEWNTAEALAVRYEEGVETGIDIGVGRGIGIGREEGIGIGREEGIDIGVSKNRDEVLGLIRKGYSSADIEKFLLSESKLTEQ